MKENKRGAPYQGALIVVAGATGGPSDAVSYQANFQKVKQGSKSNK